MLKITLGFIFFSFLGFTSNYLGYQTDEGVEYYIDGIESFFIEYDYGINTFIYNEDLADIHKEYFNQLIKIPNKIILKLSNNAKCFEDNEVFVFTESPYCECRSDYSKNYIDYKFRQDPNKLLINFNRLFVYLKNINNYKELVGYYWDSLVPFQQYLASIHMTGLSKGEKTYDYLVYIEISKIMDNIMLEICRILPYGTAVEQA